MNYQQEQQTWQEMLETLQEMHELQEAEMIQDETGVTQPVQAAVIRVRLTPGTAVIFGHPSRIVGALGKTQAPLTGRNIAPVKEINTLTGEVSHGVVYAPNMGSQEFEFSFLGKNALRKAGGWLGRQLTKLPQLAKRVQSIKALTSGKPCPGCERQFAQRIGSILPRKVNFQFNRTPGRGLNVNLSGVGAQGQQFGGQFNNSNGNWNLSGNYQDTYGNQAQLSGQGSPGNWSMDAGGNVNGHNFDAGASADGSNYAGHGMWQGPGGNHFAGGAVSGGGGQFQGAGAVNTPGMSANANVNWQQESGSMLGEIFNEMNL